VFISDHSLDTIITCSTLPEYRGIHTDHLPILTKLNLNIPLEPPVVKCNYREVDWEQYRETLERKLTRLSTPSPILTQQQLDNACSNLTKIIQDTSDLKVLTTKLCLKTKRWWTKELTMLHREANKLGWLSYKNRDKPFHYMHAAHTDTDKNYHRMLQSTKMHHWRDWLEKAEDPDIWTVNKILAAPATDGGTTRIPVLKYTINGAELTASTNEEKGQVLAKSFFPAKPLHETDAVNITYPMQCDKAGRISKEVIVRKLHRLKLYKAPGPDGIPNIILTKCADLLVDSLHQIYSAIYDRKLHYEPWKQFTTIVLRKPGKPTYDVPKAYRPIALHQ